MSFKYHKGDCNKSERQPSDDGCILHFVFSKHCSRAYVESPDNTDGC